MANRPAPALALREGDREELESWLRFRSVKAGLANSDRREHCGLTTQLANLERVVLQRDAELALTVLHSDYSLVLVHPVPAAMPRDRWLDVLPTISGCAVPMDGASGGGTRHHSRPVRGACHI